MLSKKTTVLYLILAILFLVSVNGVIVYFKFFKESQGSPLSTEAEPPGGILNSLATPPSDEESGASAQIINSLDTPGKGGAAEDILNNLAAPK